MLNNHLTFILSGCRYLALGLVIVSCAKVVSNQSNEPSLKRGTVKNESCYSRHQDFDGKNLVKVAQIKSSVLKNCFLNYLRFEKNKKQKIQVCNQLYVKRNGKVSFVQVTDLNKRNLPKDFKMCLKQEFWKMSFSGLDLRRSYSIQFPLNFSSI
ncbi:MAG: hypothetical protein QF441_00125 [Bacteriovoracaceae bacterium]|jgi:hypothetical protein|nr:hypothetical protein [Halobacteriovoraceae bacterium]MDP7318975.1 hypothetical protein [Bacteriovoracaceae bacterium]|tara:strand:- start:39 stop:500 length:462 start_codon:yes stop_codon:yes gene_type:complete